MHSAALLKMKFETIAVRAGTERDGTGAIAPPLHLSTNYEHGPAGERVHGYIYTRVDKPTQRRLETALAAVEGVAGEIHHLLRDHLRIAEPVAMVGHEMRQQTISPRQLRFFPTKG